MRTYSLLVFVAAVVATHAAEVRGPITPHFAAFLKSNGYDNDDFVRNDYGALGSYGGKTDDSQQVKNIPIIFVHGNSDSALNTGLVSTGWSSSISYFLGEGYSTAELYATSWGNNDAMESSNRIHDCQTVTKIRRFIEAVKAYTGAPKVSIISHSMGVTIARKAVKGGSMNAPGDRCDLGPALNYVDTFVGLAGGNYGLCSCEGTGTIAPTCNKENGLWPGDSCGLNFYTCGLSPLPFSCSSPTYSSFLTALNQDTTKEADYIFSGWSITDELISYGDEVWGRPTSRIPGDTAFKTFLGLGHIQTKDLTTDDQYKWVTRHQA